MSIPVFQQWVNFQVNFAFNMAKSEILVNYKVLDLQVLFPWPKESSQSDIRVKGYSQNTKTSQNISMPRFFHLWLKRISLFLFMFPHIFDSPNSSKATSQLIFTLGFS